MLAARPSRKGSSRGEQRDLTTAASAPTRRLRTAALGGQARRLALFWIVPAFYTAFGIIFFALARVMPPPRPDVTTDQMVHFFDAHSTTSRSASGFWS